MRYFRFDPLFLLMILVTPFAVTACKSEQETVNFAHEASDLPADAQVEYGVLPNGLRYAVMANGTPSNTATLLMRIDTGSLNEQDDERGLAHFLEHMAFNGSENVPEGEMVKRLEKYGLAFGPDTNASTGFEETIYQLELPEVNDEILNETLMLMRETASNLTLDPDAINRERGVILAEKRARNSAAYKAFVARLSYYLDGSLFPDRLPIGTEEAIKSVTAEQFRHFYNGYYRPENTFIVLVGDFDTGYAATKIAEYFANWEAVGKPLESFTPALLKAREMDVEYYVDPEIRTSVSLNVMRAPDMREDTVGNRRDSHIESLGNRILARRLSKQAQTVDAPFIGAEAGTSNVYDIFSISSVSLSSRPEDWAAALAVGEQELRRAYLHGFTQAELDEQIAITRQSRQVAVQTSSTRRTPLLARRIMGSFSDESVFTSPAHDLEAFENYADHITPQQVHAEFRKIWAAYETPQIYLSTSEIIENPRDTILEAFRDSQAVEVESGEEADPGEFAYTDFGPAGEVVERATIADIGIETVRFGNNVRLNIKKTPYQKNIINLSVAFGQGELALPRDNPGLRWFAPSIMTSGGLKAHSADDIQTLMAGKSVGAGFSMGTRRFYLGGSTTPEHLPDQLNLMAALISAPGFRAESVARYGKLIESLYPTLDSTPAGVAQRDADRIVRSGDPRFGIPDEEALLGVSMETLVEWITPGLQNSAMEIAVVGDVDVGTVIAEVARTFGAFPSRSINVPVYSSGVTRLTFPEGSKQPVILSHTGEPDTALLLVYWPGPDGRSDVTASELDVLQSVFENRLNDVLREELGSTYSPGAFNFASRDYPDFGYFGVSVEVNPDDIDQVQARIFDLATEIQTGTVTQDEFDRAITPIRENIEESLENNGYWMNVIGEAQTDPERLDRHRRRTTLYRNMKLDDVIRRGESLFENSKSITLYILPEE